MTIADYYLAGWFAFCLAAALRVRLLHVYLNRRMDEWADVIKDLIKQGVITKEWQATELWVKAYQEIASVPSAYDIVNLTKWSYRQFFKPIDKSVYYVKQTA